MTTKERNYRVIPYFFLFAPFLISPFLDKSVQSMSIILSWALALFVYPLFLLKELGRTQSYRSILKSHANGEELQGSPQTQRRSWLEYSWLVLLPALFALMFLNLDFPLTYALLAITALIIATIESYPAFVKSKLP